MSLPEKQAHPIGNPLGLRLPRKSPGKNSSRRRSQGETQVTSLIVFMGPFLLSASLMVASVIAFRAWRKRDDRRSPLSGKKLANLPGQQLTARINDHGDEMLSALVIMYLSIPLMVFGWALTRMEWKPVRLGFNEVLFAISAVAVFLFGLHSFIRNWDGRNRARDGLVAEQMTGQLLNRLIGPECIVAHDLPCEGFNIDHVVICSSGVYAIETKSFRKPRSSADDTHYKVAFDGEALRFRGWHDSGPVEQARRQGQWLANYLRTALGREIPVSPALAIPGWWIEKTESGKRSDVRVFTPMGRGAEFLLRGQSVLDAPSRALVAQAIALRYPDIAD